MYSNFFKCSCFNSRGSVAFNKGCQDIEWGGMRGKQLWSVSVRTFNFCLGRLIQEIQESEYGLSIWRFKLLFLRCRGVISVHTNTSLLQFYKYIQVSADFQSEVSELTKDTFHFSSSVTTILDYCCFYLNYFMHKMMFFLKTLEMAYVFPINLS
jgi:hypothetical protein